MKAVITLFALMVSALSTIGQMGACEIQSTDSSLFKLTVKGLSLGDSAQSVWRFSGNPGIYEIHLFPSDSASRYMKSNVEIVPGMTRSYDLFFGEDPNEFALGVTSEMTYSQNLTEVILDDTALAAVEALNRGDAGQFPPLTNPAFDNLLEGLRGTYFQKERSALIKDYLSENITTIDELRQILASIDAEDRRLEITLSAAGSLDEPERLTDLEDLFYLASSKQRIQRVAASAASE